ncbi:MAG: RNA polymerase sigma factor, partial [Bacteroidales bacterium]
GGQYHRNGGQHRRNIHNKVAFEELYSLFKDKVYNTAISYLQNIEDAEEVTQDVFLSIYVNAHTFKRNSKVSTWIYRITVNKALNKLDKRNRKPNSNIQLEDSFSIDFQHPGILLENQENAAYLFGAIDTLLPSQKTAFILVYIEGLPQQEVALIMENTVKAVESLLQRAKINLKKILIEHYPEGK